jgi:hypothetical protein
VADLGRTLGLVAPAPAEYRLLGVNEPLLTTLRSATGGRAIETAAEVWTHDLRSTAFATDLWPLLLVLALLLYPIDVAVRRVSISRREVAAGRAWFSSRVFGRGRAVRPEAVGGMLAAKERAAGSRSRAALVRPPVGSSDAARSTSEAAAAAAASPSSPPAVAPPAAPTSKQPGEPAPTAPPTAQSSETDTLARLREAKKRAQR